MGSDIPDRMGERERPWRDRETLERYWYDSGMTLEELSDEFGCGKVTIHRWVGRFGFDRRQDMSGEWRDAERMYRLYWGERLTTQEIADELGCSQPCVSRWLRRHDIPTRHTAKEHGRISTTESGYEYFCVDSEMVWVHRLLAVAEFGIGSVDGKQVHHKNGVPWDNRPENIEPLSVAEHTEKHRDELIRARHG